MNFYTRLENKKVLSRTELEQQKAQDQSVLDLFTKYRRIPLVKFWSKGLGAAVVRLETQQKRVRVAGGDELGQGAYVEMVS